MTSTTMTTTAKNSGSGLRPIDKLLPLLSGVVEDGDRKWKAFCPIHEADGGSHDPSLHIEEAADGKLLLHCFPCGSDVKAPHFCMAVGLSQSDLYPDHARQFTGDRRRSYGVGSKREGLYEYRDEQGGLLFRVEKIRLPDGSKECPASRPNGDGGWIAGIRGVKRVLYKLPELILSSKEENPKPVFIAEGEGKVDALMAWGLVATCNPGGAGKWNKEFSKYLAGRDVIILPDNDPIDTATGACKGMDHARKVLEYSKPVAKSVRILELPGLPPKGDIIDWIEMGGTLPQLLELVSAPPGEELTQLAVMESRQTVIAELDPLDLQLPEGRTDVAQGRRLIRDHGDFIRFCYPWGKWLIWDGKRWMKDQSGEVPRRTKLVCDALWPDMRKVSGNVSDEMFQKILGYVQSRSGAGAIARAMECAASEPGVSVMPDQMDSDPWLLNCQNGTLNLQTGEIGPHRQSDMLTMISPTEFDPDARCPAWEQFLISIFESQEMVDYIQRLCGCWATGFIREESLPVLWGEGSNGKTTFLTALLEVLGPDYSMKAPANFLMAKKFETHPTDKADLFRKRLVVCSESGEGQRLDEAFVKDATGRERIRARRMREDNWEFDPTHKLVLMTNHIPAIRGTDHGIWRRIRKIAFGRKFWNPDKGESGPPELRQDNTLKDRLKDEYPGILTWIVRGCLLWWHDGEQAPDVVTSWTEEYRDSQDVFGQFLEECCETYPSAFVSTSDLYAAYHKWAKDGQEFIMNRTKFGLIMSEKGFQRDPGKRHYIGITLLSQKSF